jgi:hypothetical protein
MKISRENLEFTFTTSADTDKSTTVPAFVNGVLKGLQYSVPDFANLAASGYFELYGPDAQLWHRFGPWAPGGSDAITGIELCLVGGETVTFTAAAAVSGAATVISKTATVRLFIDNS